MIRQTLASWAMLLLLMHGTVEAEGAHYRPRHKRSASKAASTLSRGSVKEPTAAARTFAPRFAQPNHVYDAKLPLVVRVNADDARVLKDVRVRVFPNKDAVTVRKSYIELTQSGCRILASRLEPYFPTFSRPDIELRQVYPFEMRCDEHRKYLVTTPFVLVVEADDGDQTRFLQIKPGKALDTYFRSAYQYYVQPDPHQPCPPSITQSDVNTDTATKSRAGLFAHRGMIEHETNNACVTEVTEKRPY